MTAFPGRLVPALTLVLTLGLLLAACSQPTEQEPQPETVDLMVNELPGSPVLLGATFVMVDFSASPLSAASVIEVEPGAFVGPLAGLNDDGTVSGILPEEDDVPTSTLINAADFLYGYGPGPTCSFVASDAAARVSQTTFELVSFPGFFAMTVGGLAPAAVTTAPIIDPSDLDELYGHTYVTWVFADRPVTIVTEPALCDIEGDFELGVDLSLQQGWNQVAWTIGQDDPLSSDATGLYLADSDHEGLYISPTGFF